MTRHGSRHVAIIVFAVLVQSWPQERAKGQCSCPADVNQDLTTDARDIQSFVDCLVGGPPGCGCADVDLDLAVNMADIPLFVGRLLGKPNPCPQLQCLEPGTWEIPPASPCNEKTCSVRPDAKPVHSVHLFSGEFCYSATDLRIKGRGMDFIWARKYRSKCGFNTAMGNGWDFSYNIRVEQSGADRIIYDGNGRFDLYLTEGPTWGRDEFFRELSLDGGTNEHVLTFADKGKWVFRPLNAAIAPGKIDRIVDRNQNTMTFAYDGSGRLVTITDTLSRSITLAYDGSGMIASVTDFNVPPRQVVYAFYTNPETGGSAGDLKAAQSPLVTGTPNANDFATGKTTTYTYSENLSPAARNSNLLSITDPKGQTWLVNTYSLANNPADLSFDRVVAQQWGNPGDDSTIAYALQNPPGESNSSAVIKVAVTDRNGNLKHYYYDGLNRLVVSRELTTGLRPGEPSFWETKWTYNADSLLTQLLHPNGNSENHTYEFDVNPVAPRRMRGNLLQTVRLPGPLGGDQSSITESFTYETGFGGCGCGTNFVKTHTDGRSNTTSYTYDANGNRIHTDHRTNGGVEDWTYNAFGQMASHNLPANGSGHRRLDSYEYYTAATDPTPGDIQVGYLRRHVVNSGGANLTTTYEYDARGNVLRKIDPRGNDTLHTVNQLDQIVRELSRQVGPARYESLTWYDANDNMVRRDLENRNENGTLQANTHFTVIFEYEQTNRTIRICREKATANLTNAQLTCGSFPAGTSITTEYTYDANGNQTLVLSPVAVNGSQLNNTVDTEYDERDLVFKNIRAKNDGAVKSTDQTDYDGNKNIARTVQGTEDAGPAHEVTYSYDGYDRLTASTDARGNVTTYEYDANGNRTLHHVDGELLDAAGGAGNLRLFEVTYQYDAMDRRIQRHTAHFDTQPPQPNTGDGQSTTTWVYANNSQATSMTSDLLGHVTTYTYDTVNRLSVSQDAKNNTQTYSYDANSNVITVVELDKSDVTPGPGDQSLNTTYSYDAVDRLTQTVDNMGQTHLFFYDSRGNLVNDRNHRLKRTQYTYDGLSRLVRTVRDMNDNAVYTDPVDVQSDQSWDDSSRLVSKTNDDGYSTAYAYDSLDRLTLTDFADCTTATKTYDVHDQVLSSTDGNGTTVTNTYDALDRLTNRTISVGPTTFEIYQYDGLSRLIRAEDNDSLVTRGSVSTSGYDSLNNVLRETQQRLSPAGPPLVVTRQVDGESNTTRLLYPGGRDTRYSYDALNRLTEVRDFAPGPIIATYKYLGPHRIERRDYASPAVARYEPTYDGIRRLTRSRHIQQPGGAVIEDRNYVLDANGNKTLNDNLLWSPPPNGRQYTYDSLDRLVTTQKLTPPPLDTQIVYTLDGPGNRTNVAGGLSPGAYTLSPTTCIPADDQMNQYTATPFHTSRLYDNNGNFTDINSGALTFTYDYRNQMVIAFRLSTGQTMTYQYDALGRRIARDVPGFVTRHVYDGVREIEERNAADAVVATFVRNDRRNSPAAPPIVCADADALLTTTRGVIKYYYHADEVGDVLALTTSTGAVTERYIYDDYGATTIYQPGDYAQPIETNSGYLSDLDPNPFPADVIADDFTLNTPTQISMIRWHGFYGNAVAPDNFTIYIFQDFGGQPGGSPLYSAGPPATVTRTIYSGSTYQYEHTLSPPFFAAAGVRYWLEIVNNLTGSSYWVWRIGTPGNNIMVDGPTTFGSWTQNANDLTFVLNPTQLTSYTYLYHGFRLDFEVGFYWSGSRYHSANAGRYNTRLPGDEIPIELVPLTLVSMPPQTVFDFNNPAGIDPSHEWFRFEPVITLPQFNMTPFDASDLSYFDRQTPQQNVSPTVAQDGNGTQEILDILIHPLSLAGNYIAKSPVATITRASPSGSHAAGGGATARLTDWMQQGERNTGNCVYARLRLWARIRVPLSVGGNELPSIRLQRGLMSRQ